MQYQMTAQFTSLLCFTPIQASLTSKLNVGGLSCPAVTFRVSQRSRKGSTCSSAQAPAQETHIHPLSVWLESRGVPSKKLGSQPKIIDGRLCLVATRANTKGQILAAIPQKAWLTQQTVSESPIGVFVEELDGWLQICLFLLYEQNKQSSAWGPYIDSLPEQVDLPLFWSQQELQELQGTQLLSSVEGYRCEHPTLLQNATRLNSHYCGGAVWSINVNKVQEAQRRLTQLAKAVP